MNESPDWKIPSSSPSLWRDWLLAIVVSAVAALAIVAIFAVRGAPSGHDFQFHGAMWLEVANQWRQGILLPRWAEWANWGFGEPRFIFYPPLSWMLGAALGLVAGWKLAAGSFVVAAQTLAGVSMFALARRTLARRAALFAAFAYAANPYTLLVVYLRSDFAEELAAAIFPLLLLTLSDLAEAGESRAAARHAGRFALVFAAIWLCNAPAGVLASYSAALLFGWMSLRARSWRPLLLGAGGIGLGFGISAFYLIPAVYEQRWVRIGEALSSGLRPSENFLFTSINDPEHNVFNWIASATAVGMILIAGAAGVVAHRKAESGAEKKQWQGLMLIAAAATALMIPISSALWRFLPELKYLQFPWRWMLVLAVPFAYFLAAAMRGRFGWVWGVLFLVTAGSTGTMHVKHTWWDADDIPTLQEAIEQGQGYEGVDEYDTVGDDRTDLPQNAPRAQILPVAHAQKFPETRLHEERWTAEEKVLTVTLREEAQLKMRLLNYPAWRVKIDGHGIRPAASEETVATVLPLSPGTHRIEVKFGRTTDRTAGIVVSGLALFAVLVLLWAEGRPLLARP